MKLVTIVGARPQFIKAATLAAAMRRKPHPGLLHHLVHTGQHHDHAMSEVFFDELQIGAPDHNLEVSGGTHGVMTGRMLERLDALLTELRPDWVLVYGDTNSTLAGALAASKMHIRVAHVEAGLRSFNMRMPEEINRIVTDRLSDLLFCPTRTAVDNLHREGVTRGIHAVGDVMYDAALQFAERAAQRSTILQRLDVAAAGYVLATCHRAENTDDAARLEQILRGLAKLARTLPVVFPVHPRTRQRIIDHHLDGLAAGLHFTEPLAYFDMLILEKNARMVVTDSGGVQKEAFFYGVPCITTRDETEWIETVELGWNVLVGADADAIGAAFEAMLSKPRVRAFPYGEGHAAELILETLVSQG